MSSIKLMLVAGARPNFMKVAPIIRAINAQADTFSHVLVHTGQHYDDGMSEVFFRDLGIPSPHHHLNVGSGSHAQQTARIMTAFEPILEAEKPTCVMVFGDVNSTLACSIVAKKLNYLVAHVEAGLRSGDRKMPEEINRIVTDSISDIFFVTEESGLHHLRQEGKAESDVHHVGHVMIDNLLFEVARLRAEASNKRPSDDIRPKAERYGVVTLHRPSNVDNASTLRDIFGALSKIAELVPLVFPVHPRTQGRINEYQIEVPNGIQLVEPLGYREFLDLWKDAAIVLTDSGGLQEETTAIGVPCLTLRENTERPITIHEGTNVLVGTDPEKILRTAEKILSNAAKASDVNRPSLWDGKASERILDILRIRLGAVGSEHAEDATS